MSTTSVRALDDNHDFTFGKGTNDYFRDIDAVVQNLNTRLLSVVGDCFFDLGAGVDWFNFIGSKDQQSLNLAISTVILNTAYVIGLLQLSTGLDSRGNFTASYQVQTGFSVASSSFTFNTNTIG